MYFLKKFLNLYIFAVYNSCFLTSVCVHHHHHHCESASRRATALPCAAERARALIRDVSMLDLVIKS